MDTNSNFFDTADYDLTPAQLDDKYNPDGDGEHPQYTKQAWRAEVNEEETLLGYWEWVSCQTKKP